MKKGLLFLMCALCVLFGSTAAQAETVYKMVGYGEGGYLTEITPGQKVAIQLGSATDVCVIDTGCLSTTLPSVVRESAVFEFELVDASTNQYRLKHCASGLYVTLGGNSQGYASLQLSSSTSSPSWYVNQAVQYGSSSEVGDDADWKTVTYLDCPGAFIFTTTYWTSQVVHLCGSQSQYCWFSTTSYSPNYNCWYVYPVEEAGGLDKLMALFSYYYPNGEFDVFTEGDEALHIPSAEYNAAKEAFETALDLINNSSEDTDACEAAAEALVSTYDAAVAAQVKFSEGYYFIVNHSGTNHALFENENGCYVNTETWSVPDVASADDLPYIWYLESNGEENTFYIKNFVSGNYVGFVASTSKVIPTITEATYPYNIYQFPGLDINWVALDGGTYCLHHTTNGTNRVQYWDTSHKNSAWQLTKIPQEQIDNLQEALEQQQRNEKLNELYQEANEFYKSGFAYSSDATDDCDFSAVDGLVTEVSQLSTNAQEPTEGPIDNLLDADETTFFHTAWSTATGTTYHNMTSHFNKSVEAVTLKYCGRYGSYTGVTNGRPKKVHIYTSNDAQTWTDQGYVTFSYYNTSSDGTIENFGGLVTATFDGSYEYMQMDVEENMGSARSSSGELYFFLGEYRAYEATYDPDNSIVERVDADIRKEFENALNQAYNAIQNGTATDEDYETLKAAYEKYKENYPDASLLTDLIEEYQKLLDSAEEDAEALGYYQDGSKTDFQDVIDEVSANLEDMTTIDAIKDARESLENAYAEFLSKLNCPESGKVYYMKEITNGSYAYVLNNDYAGTRAEMGGSADANVINRLIMMWKVVKQDDGTFAFQNLGTGLYLENPLAEGNYYVMQRDPEKSDSISWTLKSSDQAGSFYVQSTGDYILTNYTNSGNLITYANTGTYSRFEFIEVDDWGGSAYVDATADAPTAFTLPYPIYSDLGDDGDICSVIGVRRTSEGDYLELKTYDDGVVIEAGTPFVVMAGSGIEGINFVPAFDDLTAIQHVLTPGTNGGLYGALAPVTLSAGQGKFTAGTNLLSIAADGDETEPNSAYVVNSETSDTEEVGDYSIPIDGETGEFLTGIRDILVNGVPQSGKTFDLQGRRVAKPANGVFIVNGQKVFVK